MDRAHALGARPEVARWEQARARAAAPGRQRLGPVRGVPPPRPGQRAFPDGLRREDPTALPSRDAHSQEEGRLGQAFRA
ncbi:MAG TPA: hypothetical protein VE549_03535, partial [Myxococcaceae bacterium]|nr:hypothetical protein [Myxococcaceae bacterium]